MKVEFHIALFYEGLLNRIVILADWFELDFLSEVLRVTNALL